MYPDEIAGVKRGEEKNIREVAERDVNPSYNPTDENDPYSKNCQCTVIAADLQCRGFDVEAMAWKEQKVQELAYDISGGYIEPRNGKPCTPDVVWVDEGESCYDYVKNKYPNNVRCILRYKTAIHDPNYKDDVGHRILVGKEKDGEIFVFDPQTHDLHLGEDAKIYLDGTINKESIDLNSYTTILRIDNKIPNPYYINDIVKKHR